MKSQRELSIRSQSKPVGDHRGFSNGSQRRIANSFGRSSISLWKVELKLAGFSLLFLFLSLLYSFLVSSLPFSSSSPPLLFSSFHFASLGFFFSLLSFHLHLYSLSLLGENVPSPAIRFKDLKLPRPILESLRKQNILRPSPIQMQGIPAVLSGRGKKLLSLFFVFLFVSSRYDRDCVYWQRKDFGVHFADDNDRT